MPEKKKTNDYKAIYTAFTAFSITLLITLWNVFANQDRSKEKTDAIFILAPTPAIDDKYAVCAMSSSEKLLSEQCLTVTRTRSS